MYFGRNHCMSGDTKDPTRGSAPTPDGENGNALTGLGPGGWGGGNSTLGIEPPPIWKPPSGPAWVGSTDPNQQRGCGVGGRARSGDWLLDE